MISCKLGEKNYIVDFVSGRALREIGPAQEMYARVMRAAGAASEGEDVVDAATVQDALDTMVNWFRLVFRNQFTLDEVYDLYPSDRLMHDVALTLMAVQTGVTNVLSEFPTTAAPAATD